MSNVARIKEGEAQRVPRGPLVICVMHRDGQLAGKLRGDAQKIPSLWDLLQWEFVISSLQTGVPTFKRVLGQRVFKEINFCMLTVL